MTEQQTRSEERYRGAQQLADVVTGSTSRRTNTDVIRAGLGFILNQQQGRCWPDLGLPSGEADVRTTACVLARLGELPLHYLSRSLQQRMDLAVEWLLQARTPNGGWSSVSGDDDAETTAWVVLALRGLRRTPAPSGALDLLRRCRRLDGGFAARPTEASDSPYLKSTPEITALALRALGEADHSGQAFLASHLQHATERPATSLSFCAEILEWERGSLMPSLLQQVVLFVARATSTNVMEEAWLLRCSLRLRLQRAWQISASLRDSQLEDGSWTGRTGSAQIARSGLDDRKVIATATAISGLALGEFQPGLYFGSDSPAPRRLPAF